ncbi:MAG: hypothetical protein MHM6MM_005725 [Cercozoa sp. M6MM]
MSLARFLSVVQSSPKYKELSTKEREKALQRALDPPEKARLCALLDGVVDEVCRVQFESPCDVLLQLNTEGNNTAHSCDIGSSVRELREKLQKSELQQRVREHARWRVRLDAFRALCHAFHVDFLDECRELGLDCVFDKLLHLIESGKSDILRVFAESSEFENDKACGETSQFCRAIFSKFGHILAEESDSGKGRRLALVICSFGSSTARHVLCAWKQASAPSCERLIVPLDGRVRPFVHVLASDTLIELLCRWIGGYKVSNDTSEHSGGAESLSRLLVQRPSHMLQSLVLGVRLDRKQVLQQLLQRACRFDFTDSSRERRLRALVVTSFVLPCTDVCMLSEAVDMRHFLSRSDFTSDHSSDRSRDLSSEHLRDGSSDHYHWRFASIDLTHTVTTALRECFLTLLVQLVACNGERLPLCRAFAVDDGSEQNRFLKRFVNTVRDAIALNARVNEILDETGAADSSAAYVERRIAQFRALAHATTADAAYASEGQTASQGTATSLSQCCHCGNYLCDTGTLRQETTPGTRVGHPAYIHVHVYESIGTGMSV